jgi:hypothetical protein
VRDTTVSYLTSRPAPSFLPDSRLPFERHIHRVHAAVTLVRPEDDSDLHVVVEDGKGRLLESLTRRPRRGTMPGSPAESEGERWVESGRVRLSPLE